MLPSRVGERQQRIRCDMVRPLEQRYCNVRERANGGQRVGLGGEAQRHPERRMLGQRINLQRADLARVQEQGAHDRLRPVRRARVAPFMRRLLRDELRDRSFRDRPAGGWQKMMS